MKICKILAIIIHVVLLASPAIAENAIQLSSEVSNGRLIPLIVINGKPVMKIQDKGVGDDYESNFHRAEQIYSNLIDLETKGIDISQIRVRRYKTTYFAQVKRSRVFTVSKGDVVANKSSAYQVAKLWTDAIKDAAVPLKTEAIPDSLDQDIPVVNYEQVEPENNGRVFALAAMLTRLTESGVKGLLYLLFFCLIQAGIAYAIGLKLLTGQAEEKAQLQEQIDALKKTLDTQNQAMQRLESKQAPEAPLAKAENS